MDVESSVPFYWGRTHIITIVCPPLFLCTTVRESVSEPNKTGVEMIFSEMLEKLEVDYELIVSPSRVRWAITTKKVERPRVDKSFRFDFSDENIKELAAYFQKKQLASV